MPERNEMKSLVERIALEHIEPDPAQPRRRIDTDSPQWLGLVESIRRFGVLEPVLLRPCPKAAGRYIIICGERRWRAEGEAGLGQVPAQVIHQELLIAKKSQVQLMENALREGLEPLDELDACLRLIAEEGLSKTELARLLGVTKVGDAVSQAAVLDHLMQRGLCATVVLPRASWRSVSMEEHGLRASEGVALVGGSPARRSRVGDDQRQDPVASGRRPRPPLIARGNATPRPFSSDLTATSTASHATSRSWPSGRREWTRGEWRGPGRRVIWSAAGPATPLPQTAGAVHAPTHHRHPLVSRLQR